MILFKDATIPVDVADGGGVTGYAATFDREPDCYGDVIAPGAFADSLERWKEVGKPIPLLYGHNTQDPRYNIGAVTRAEEDGRGLLVEAEFDGESECAQQVRHLVRTGRLYQLSFAFDVLEDGEVTLDGGARAHELRRLELYEVSLVQIPANQHAEVTEVKERGSKYGRRNSKADEDTISQIGDLLDQARTLLDSLTAGDGGGSGDGDGGGDGDDDKGREAARDLLAYVKRIETED